MKRTAKKQRKITFQITNSLKQKQYFDIDFIELHKTDIVTDIQVNDPPAVGSSGSNQLLQES